MAKFSLARVPYYIAVAIFMSFVAIISYINNTLNTGFESDLYLAALAVSIGLGAVSVLYVFISKSGDDDEVGVEVAGLPFGKKYYYLAVLAIAGWRIIVGYQMNHNGTGIQSTYGIAWIITAIGIAGFTWANYRSYMARHPTAVL
jgi:hypothetical protein